MGVLTLVLWLCCGVTSSAWAGPARNATVAPGDCAGCHIGDTVLPAAHSSTKDMDADGCGTCHGLKEKTLRGRMPLAHAHMLNGLSCGDCHDRGAPSGAFSGMKKCLSCHEGGKEVAARTGGKDPNPHDSDHYGTDMDCEVCHHMHRQSENFCMQCHDFEWIVP